MSMIHNRQGKPLQSRGDVGQTHIDQVSQELLLQRPFRHNASMCHQHAMAWNAQTERHVPEVCHILSCEVLKVPAEFWLQSKQQALCLCLKRDLLNC